MAADGVDVRNFGSFCSNLIVSKHFTDAGYDYYHYVCDGFDDRGWGCGYRTLQTLCSWIINNSNVDCEVPNIRRIQEILVSIEDKPQTFNGSKQWIGSVEVCLVIDKLFDVPCKILHVNKGSDLKTILKQIKDHFNEFGSPIMMGGDVDASSKGILGVCSSETEDYLLVMDPHYVGKKPTMEFLMREGWIKWQPLSEFLNSSFYNLCLPQIRSKLKM